MHVFLFLCSGRGWGCLIAKTKKILNLLLNNLWCSNLYTKICGYIIGPFFQTLWNSMDERIFSHEGNGVLLTDLICHSRHQNQRTTYKRKEINHSTWSLCAAQMGCPNPDQVVIHSFPFFQITMILQISLPYWICFFYKVIWIYLPFYQRPSSWFSFHIDHNAKDLGERNRN